MTQYKAQRKLLIRAKRPLTIGGVEHILNIMVYYFADKANSRFVYADRMVVQVFGKGTKGIGVQFGKFRMPIRKGVIDTREVVETIMRDHSDGLTTAVRDWYLNFHDGKASQGVVRWYDKSRGQGWVKDALTGNEVTLYACNVIGAKSPYAEFNPEISFEQGEVIRYKLFSFGHNGGLSASKVERKV